MGTLVDIDGNLYDTVVIGTQEWTVQNFKCARLNDGTAISEVTDNFDWYILTYPGRCAYDNDPANRAIYGELYNWQTVNTGKLAPEGWRVPTNDDWGILTTYLGGEISAGGKMKETGTTHWLSPNTCATNESGFSALPGGYRASDGNFDRLGNECRLWSSSMPVDRYLCYDSGYLLSASDSWFMFHGESIRLVRDIKTITINQSQFNWTPPSDYPFTKNNDLYDKDIDYIRANKKKLKPFSGITAPPNPGYNFSAYPGYETGLFGYSRKDYRVSGSGE